MLNCRRNAYNFIKRNSFKRLMAFILTLAMLMSASACGNSEVAEAPELMTPVSLTESCRPAEKRDIGEVVFLKGIVTPEAYPVFTGKSIALYELKVDPGDEVKEGDVIATGDTRELDSKISSLNKDLEMLRLRRNTEETISEKIEEQLKYKRKAAEETGLSDYAEAYGRKISKERENRRYDLATIDASISSINKEIAELKKTRDGMTFKAPHSGTVTYLVDISSSNYVGANENIAVVSDFSKLFIETGETTKSYKYENYSDKYIMAEGRRLEVEEVPYTSAELSYADNMGNYPPVRFQAEGAMLEPGATVPIYFVKDNRSQVLAVGNDSIYTEEEETYCYVKTADGQKEKRTLILGVKDSLYSEVQSGLSEGEMVFYDSTAVIPVNYREYQVKTGDYVEENYSEYITELLTGHDTCLAEVEGSVKEVVATVGSDVEKGDVILKLEIPVSHGELAEAKNGLADLEAGRRSQLAEYDRREKEIRGAIEKARADITAPAAEDIQEPPQETEEDVTAPAAEDIQESSQEKEEDVAADQDKEALLEDMYKAECLQLELDIIAAERKLSAENYNRSKARLTEQLNRLSGYGTDGTYTVKAPRSGKLGQSLPAVGTTVYRGQYLFTVNSSEDNILRISMPKKRGQDAAKAASAGQKLSFKTDDKVYTGTCVAENGYEDRLYLFTRDGDVHLTRSRAYSAGQTQQFFAVTEDESYFEGEELPSAVVTFQGVVIHGGIIVPAKAVYTEKDVMTQNTSTFVWKVTDSGLAKQEVTVFENGQFSETRLILSGLSADDVIAVE